MKIMKKQTILMLAVVLVFLLSACGAKEENNPNLGKYLGDQINILEWTDMSEIYPGENYIELKSGGKGDFCLEGDSMSMEWTEEEGKITITMEGEKCTGTLTDGVLAIEDFFGVKMPMIFAKEGAEVPDMTEDGETEEAEEAEEAEETKAETEEESVDAEYGKSTADATGIIDFDTLKEGFAWLSKTTGAEGDYTRPPYEEVREKLGGVDGRKTHEDSWKEDYHVYIWETEDKKDFLLLSFKVAEDGSEKWNSSSWSNGLSNEE